MGIRFGTVNRGSRHVVGVLGVLQGCLGMSGGCRDVPGNFMRVPSIQREQNSPETLKHTSGLIIAARSEGAMIKLEYITVYITRCCHLTPHSNPPGKLPRIPLNLSEILLMKLKNENLTFVIDKLKCQLLV